MDASRELIAAWLWQCAREYPYYSRAIAAMTPVEDPTIHTLAVDRYWRLYYSPAALAVLRESSPAELVRHEVEHLLRDHDGRRDTRDPRAWNIAGDCEINDDLDLDLLPSWVCVGDPHGLTAEEYYERAPAAQRPSCDGGSGAGAPRDGELPPGAAPAVTDAPALRRAVAGDIAAAPPGTVPDDIRVWADAQRAHVRPPADWRRVVERWVTAAGREDYSYSRLSRRQHGPVLFPASIACRGRVTVVLDTSGSMEMLGDAAAGVLDVILRHADVDLIDCDAAARRPRQVRSWRDVRASRGGGGTDMRVGIAAARGRCIVITDGETPWPDPWPRGVVAIVLGDPITVRP